MMKFLYSINKQLEAKLQRKQYFHNHAPPNESLTYKPNKTYTGCTVKEIKELKNRRDISYS